MDYNLENRGHDSCTESLKLELVKILELSSILHVLLAKILGTWPR